MCIIILGAGRVGAIHPLVINPVILGQAAIFATVIASVMAYMLV